MKQQVAAVFIAVMICTTNAVAGGDRTYLHTSRVAIQNIGSATATVQVTAIDTSLNETNILESIPVGRSIYLNGENFGMQPGYHGSVVVQSDQPIRGVVQNDLTSSIGENLGRSACTLRGPIEIDNKMYLPFLVNRNGFESRIAVQNAGSTNTDVTVDYFSDSLVFGQEIKSGLSPGAMWLTGPLNDFDGTAVVTSNNADVSVQIEITYSKNWSASYCYSAIPDKDADAQSFEPFIYNDPDGAVTSLATMNSSAGIADLVALFKGVSDTGWDVQDYPDIHPNGSVIVTPQDGTTWKIGLGLLTLIPQHAAVALTRDDSQHTLYAIENTISPVPLKDEWYLAAVNDMSEITLYSDNAAPVDFKMTSITETTESTVFYTLGAGEIKTVNSSHTQNTEGSVIIENLSAFPTGLAIEVKDKSKPGDFGAYSPASTDSSKLFIPWFTYQYTMLGRSPSRTSLLYQLISIIAAHNKNQPDQGVSPESRGPD